MAMLRKYWSPTLVTKVLIVIARLNKGGTSSYIQRLVKNLPNSYQVLVATGYVQGAEIEDEISPSMNIVRVNHLGRKINPIYDFLARREILKIIRIFNPDIVYSHTFKAGALVRTLRSKIPVIHAFHGHLIDEPELAGIRIRILLVIERLLAKRTKFIVTIGENVAIELLMAGVGHPDQYVSIPPGVEPLAIERRASARKALGINSEKRPIIVWMARVVSVKGPERLIELAKRLPNARFLLAGGGDLLQKIKSLAPSNVSVLGWQKANRMWAVADLAVSTSFNEGMPIAIIEAQLAGVPVIAVDVGSVSEVIENGVTGLVYSEFNSEYIQGVSNLIENKTLRRNMGRNAKKRALKNFSTKRMVRKHVELFSKCN